MRGVQEGTEDPQCSARTKSCFTFSDWLLHTQEGNIPLTLPEGLFVIITTSPAPRRCQLLSQIFHKVKGL